MTKLARHFLNLRFAATNHVHLLYLYTCDVTVGKKWYGHCQTSRTVCYATVSYFKFTFGLDFCIVQYVCIECNITETFCLDLIFVSMSIYENKIPCGKNSPIVKTKLVHYDGDYAMECVNHKTVETRLSFAAFSLPLPLCCFHPIQEPGNKATCNCTLKLQK